MRADPGADREQGPADVLKRPTEGTPRVERLTHMEIRSLLESLPRLLNRRIARHVRVTYAFSFSGEDPGDYTLEVRGGECFFREGLPEFPSVSISVPSEVWLAIVGKRLRPVSALLDGRMKVRGNVVWMLLLEVLFSGDPSGAHVPDGLFAETRNENDHRRGRWRRPRRVLSLQGSPRREAGATEVVNSRLLAGMAAAGAEVESLYLADMKIAPCRGCFACWKGGQNRCVHRDVMDDILPRLPETDLLVVATPLYFDGMPGPLKTFFDRLLPMGHPHIFSRRGRCRHPARHQRLPDLVLAAVCGFYEKSNFDPLVRHVAAIADNAHTPLRATLLRPAAMTLLNDAVPGPKDRVLEAFERAGAEIVDTGRVSRRTRRDVSRPVVKRGQFLAGSRGWWEEL